MADEQQANGEQAAEGENAPEIGIQRLYIKDTSFESPNAPNIFLGEWQPEMNIDLGTKTAVLEDNVHEVILTVTTTVKVKDQVAFLCEVKQAGIFAINGFPEDQIKMILGSYCPNILYPYARAVITDLVMQGGFPQLYLAPVNFDALYQQHLEQDGGKGGDAGDAGDAGAVSESNPEPTKH